ncbi:LacI family DNA-binding transcriptional regulator [Nocardioides bruguierae]|uniref:LacI family DNA-binding transcriptional regulator n=1 Tax=Nocardioides bruguierae TaxID=2945102 RepID=A0A9X2IGC8_9ACTN|nr:LacI family DNA-binding transcriptional regulator [Nocardioides bruguierae]MCM0622761.1 LacI family DNA-binding transcriptional regulator [Nocardioides bruguierae]
MANERITMARLAEELDISIATVSNAYNRPEKLSVGLRRRIEALAKELGYVGPDPTARSLRRRRTGGVGVVFTDELPFVFTDPASAGFLSGVAHVLGERDQHLVLLPAGAPHRRRRAPVDAAALDGVIFHSLPSQEATLALLQRRGTPAVLVDQPGPVDGVGWVGLDETAAMHRVGALLASLGHVNVGCITSRLGTSPRNGPADARRVARSRFTIPRDRIRGLQLGLGRPVLVEERWSITTADGADGAAALLRRNPRLTAIAAVADTYALGALLWAKDHHVQVPEHLSVTGFDDIPSATSAGLTTVRQPFDLKGRTAARILNKAFDHTGPAALERLDTELVVRSSTGPPLM